MKITHKQLRRIIKEELSRSLSEAGPDINSDGALDAPELRDLADDLEAEEKADPLRDYNPDAVKAAAYAVEKVGYPQGGMIETEIHEYLENTLGMDPMGNEIDVIGDEALSAAGIMLGVGPDTL